MNNYNVNVGVPTTIDSAIKIETYKFHPYGLINFRKKILDQIDEWQSKGLSWDGHDNLTYAWRTPWDMHIRYPELMDIMCSISISIVNQIDSKNDWEINNLWISEYTNGSAANKHDHGRGEWSFCYYVEVPDEGPGFTYFDSMTNSLHTINVNTGDLLIFKSELEHQVMPAKDKRVIISGNLCRINDLIVMKQLFKDKDFFKSNSIYSNVQDNSTDPDKWNVGMIEQKTGIKQGGGY